MILAIGYRVRSQRGTQFRRWATDRLNEYLVKGFTMNDERLKEVKNLGQDYFDELASSEYEKFNQRRLGNSLNEEDDFDRFIKENNL